MGLRLRKRRCGLGKINCQGGCVGCVVSVTGNSYNTITQDDWKYCMDAKTR